MALHLTTATDYGLRAMIHIASLPEEAVVLRASVAEAQKIPSSFMAKILRRLVRGRLLRSARGVHGGFSLGRPAAEISLLDIIEAIEGPIALTRCATTGAGCTMARDCPGSVVWPSIQTSFSKILSSLSLEELTDAPRRNGRVAPLPKLARWGVAAACE